MLNNILSQDSNNNNLFFKYLNELYHEIKYLVKNESNLNCVFNLLFNEYNKLYLFSKNLNDNNIRLENEIVDLKNEIAILKNKNKNTVLTKPPGLESTNNDYSLFNNHFNPRESINNIIKNNVIYQTDLNKDVKNNIKTKNKNNNDLNNRINMILSTEIKNIHRLLKRVMFTLKSITKNIVLNKKYTIFFKDTYYGSLFFDILKYNHLSYSLFIRMSDDPNLKYVRKFNIDEKKNNVFHISDP